MKIVHICLGAFFPDGYSYQENMLPKFHRKAGYDVEVIASLQTFDKNGKTAYYPEAKQYVNENDVLVTRLDYKRPYRIYRIFRRFVGFSQALEKAKPDIIFIHNVQFADIRVVIDYVREHRNVKVYCDNHADFSNSATNWVSKNLLHGIVWKHCAKRIEPYTKKFYGVLPARVDFLKNVYGLPPEKCELLVMGADDDAVKKADRPEVKKSVREKYHIADDDFLVMTGGKIDAFKTQTLMLMDAVNRIDNEKLKLIVFGSVVPELKEEVERRCSGRVQYIGWQKAEDSYPLFAACDLACFPGRHSVFWEQVTGQGIPMLCKKWDGTTHVDLGGNVVFLENDQTEEIEKRINELLEDKACYGKMKTVAVDNGMKVFSYCEIAKRSIEG